MSYFLNSTISSAVSLDFETSWAAKSLKDALTQAKYDARFQQKQMQEKEEKLLKLYENQQQRAFERVGRSSAGNNLSGGTSPVGTGKVRQMFDERRQKAGIDRSYPLEPLKQTKTNAFSSITNRVPTLDRSNNNISKSTIKTTSNFKQTVQRSITQSKGGKLPTTFATRQSAEVTFVNGELKSGNIEYELRNDNDTLDLLKSQEKELEIMMKNHRLDDEKFIDIGIDDDIDSIHGDYYSRPAIENGNHIKEKVSRPAMAAIENGNHVREKVVSNGNFRKPSETLSSGSTPAKKILAKTTYASLKEKTSDKLKKPSLTKSQSTPVKTKPEAQVRPIVISRPTSSVSTEKKPLMKSAAQKRNSTATTRNQTSAATGTPKVQSSVNRDDLKPCAFCNRRFAADRIQLHEDICARTLKKKRKTYDQVKHRVQGTDAENYVKRGTKTSSIKPRPHQVGKTDWRRQHEEFISAIRAAKQAQAHVARGGKLTDLPPPPPSLNPDYIQCPHCGRRFNEAAAARHIPKCATMIHNKPSKSGSMAQTKRRM